MQSKLFNGASFSQVVSEIRRSERACDDFADDPITIAYGVCSDLMPFVAQAQDESTDAILAKYNLTREQYNDELRARLSGHFVFFRHMYLRERN